METLPMLDTASPEIYRLSVHDHPCSIYESPEELKRQFVPYLQAGLIQGERCIYFVAETATELVIEAMREDGFNLTPYLESGAFAVISTKDAHLKGGRFGEENMMTYWTEALERSQRAGFPAMRAAVEMTWALSGAPGCEILAPYEARLNQFTDRNKVSILCQYSRRRFSASKLKAVVHAHPLLVTNDMVLENPGVVHHEIFKEDSPDLDLRVMLDNMTLIKKLQQAHDALEKAFDELHEVSYVISHELQEPLTTIRGYQKLLSVRYQGRLGEDADGFIRDCNKAANVIEKMIDDLWTYARVTKPGQSFGEVDATRALGSALKALDASVVTSEVTVTHDKLPTVFANELQLTDLFCRLIDNSIRHAGKKKPNIHISAKPRGDQWWEFVVQDDGQGIESFKVNEAFKMFNRIDKRPGPEGTGMGLPICKKIAEHHQGSLRIESDQGAGTKVFFVLSAIGSQVQLQYFNQANELKRRRRRKLRQSNP